MNAHRLLRTVLLLLGISLFCSCDNVNTSINGNEYETVTSHAPEPSATSVDSTPTIYTPTPAVDPLENLSFATELITLKDEQNKYSDYSLKCEMEICHVGNRVYGFSPQISVDKRKERIRFTENVISRITDDPELSIYTYFDMEYPLVENFKIYTGMDCSDDVDYVTFLVLALYGDFCNYGMAYGYAGYLLECSVPESFFDYSPNWEYYDLNYLCFLSPFSGEANVEICKNIALAFVNYYISNYGEVSFQELLKKSGQYSESADAIQALREYYIQESVSPKLSEIAYALGGPLYEYAAKSRFACFYPERKWVDQTSKEGIRNASFLHEDYTEVRTCFETLVSEMDAYQKHLDLFPYQDDLKVFFVKEADFPEGQGCYEMNTHSIYLDTVVLYFHEYIHALTMKKMKRPQFYWQTEGLATYYECLYSSFNTEYLEEYFNVTMSATRLMDLYHRTIGSEFKASSDWADMCDLLTYVTELYSITGKPRSKDNYYAYCSFYNYLIKKYSEKEALQCLLNDDIKGLTDKYLHQVEEEWRTSIKMRFEEEKSLE